MSKETTTLKIQREYLNRSEIGGQNYASRVMIDEEGRHWIDKQLFDAAMEEREALLWHLEQQSKFVNQLKGGQQ